MAMINEQCPEKSLIHAYNDGWSTGAETNGGAAGVLIKFLQAISQQQNFQLAPTVMNKNVETQTVK